MKYLYLLIDGLTIIGPLLLSFDKKVAFYKNWKSLFLSLFLMMLVFVPWDVAFTENQIWGFNEKYLCGIYLFKLPIEEILFFIVVPYACVFIYACLNYYIKSDVLLKTHRTISVILIIVLVVTAACNLEKLYTTITFFGTSFFLLFHVFKKTPWFSKFLLTYFVSIVPFIIVNSLLTGSSIEGEVVWYNSDHILNVRLGTIPVEDLFYSLLMLGLTIHIFENFRGNSKKFR